jgi:putative ABC transport system permease protein
MNSLFNNLRMSVRLIGRNPPLNLVLVLTLALGIGANTLIFSLLNAVLFRPLPYQKPEQLVALWSLIPKELCATLKLKSDRHTTSGPDFMDWKQQNQVFAEMAGFYVSDFNCRAGGEADRITTAGVSDGYFPTLGILPLLGRALQSSDFLPGQDHGIILSHRFWKSRLGGRPEAVGQTLYLENRAYTILGVMPAGFNLPFRVPLFPALRDPDGWVPLTPGLYDTRWLNNRGWYALGTIGRLKEKISFERAQADMNVIAERLMKAHPFESRPVQLLDLRESLYGGHRSLMLLLLAAAGIILLIVCANVANLQLARAGGRQREMAIRTALGANQGKLMGQLLSESLLVSLLGGGIGLGIVSWGSGLLNVILSRCVSAMPQVVIDARVCGFTLGISVLTGLAFGLAPAWRLARTGLHEGLKGGGRTESVVWQKHYFGKALIVSEVMLSLVLLVCVGLLVHSFIQLWQVDLGIHPKNVLTMKIPFSAGSYAERGQQSAFYREVLRGISAQPGVRYAAITSSLPTMGAIQNGIDIEGRVPLPAVSKADQSPVGNVIVVSEDYFRALGIELKRGRFFGGQDSEESLPVAIISQSMADRYFPGRDPLGAHIRESWWVGPWRTIVGVVADVRQDGMAEEAKPALYYCSTQAPALVDIKLVARTVQQPQGLATPIRKMVQALDPNQPVTDIHSMEELLQNALLERRILLNLMGVFAGIALGLAALGVYGVLSFATTQRTREFGIRMALGARPGNVLRMVMTQGMGLVFVGIVLGLAGAQAATRLLSNWLFGVPEGDLTTYASVIGLLVLVASLACYLPARRATHVDPVQALRYE